MTNQNNATTAPTLRMSKNVLGQIRAFIGQHRAERGGMLGRGPDGYICSFEADKNGRCSAAAYDPDIGSLNRVIKEWKVSGIEFCGFAHSHPAGVRRPSGYDEWYAGQILRCFKKLELLWLPIVMTTVDSGAFQVLTYAAVPSPTDRSRCNIVKGRLRVVDGGPDGSARQPIIVASEMKSPAPTLPRLKESPGELRPTLRHKYYGNFASLEPGARLSAGPKCVTTQPATTDEIAAQANAVAKRDQYLTRLGSACDLELLDATRLIVIGVGGAASLVRNCARMGYGEVVLVDPDEVTAANIFSQQAEPEAIGKPKAEALAADVVRLNPASAALAVSEPIEAIDDETFEVLLRQPMRAESTGAVSLPRLWILLVLTDNFEANARGHRLGLHFGLPTICAQEYVEGRGAEVTYTIPGVSPACHRCITSSRYAAYENGYRNTVSSTGAPIFAAEMLNAILGHVLLAVTHHSTDHPRWGNMVTMLGSRNLLRIRMDPNFDVTFGNTFGRRIAGAADAGSFVMLDTLFLAQAPDAGQSPTRPVCPDCSGTGDLRNAAGTFADTRLMRPSPRP